MDKYSVGYRKPPRDKQFKPGQSGNPRGRPKGKLSSRQLIEKYLDAKIKVMVGNREKMMTRREALIFGLIADGLKGKDKPRKLLLDLLLLDDNQASQDALAEFDSRDDDATIASLLRYHGVDVSKIKASSEPRSRPKRLIKIRKTARKEASP